MVILISRQKRHKRTFSEEERIRAQETVSKIEDEDDGEISEAEDPSMLHRDAKDWKVSSAEIPDRGRPADGNI